MLYERTDLRLNISVTGQGFRFVLILISPSALEHRAHNLLTLTILPRTHVWQAMLN